MPVELSIVESVTELETTVVEVVLESASEPGPAGPGVAAGGATGEVLTKASNTDYDTEWSAAAGGGAPTTVDYLVGTASGSLSAEIVVGATPGGELGGTWAAPTVDATHSGSSHAAVQAAAEATAAAALSAHLTDAADAHDASAISILDAANDFTATDVEGALAELQSDHETDAQNLADHIADASAAHAASAVSIDSTTLSGTGTDVQASLEEIDNLLDDHSARHENGGADEISLAGLDGTPTALQTHLDDASAAHAASAISADSTTLVGTGTDVQAVLEELDNGIADHLADTADAHDASAISIADAGDYFTGTEVEAALQELGAASGGGSTDGWTDDTAATWTYASATTFTVTGDRTAVFSKGTRLKLTQTSVKYFVCVGSSHAAGTTTVTITGGSDYTLANAAISANYYSYAANPQGYPGWFNYTPSWTGFSADPSVIARFSVIGTTCYWTLVYNTPGTSNATTLTVSLPITAAGYARAACKVMNNGTTSTTGGHIQIQSGATSADIFRTLETVTNWTASGNKIFEGEAFYQI